MPRRNESVNVRLEGLGWLPEAQETAPAAWFAEGTRAGRSCQTARRRFDGGTLYCTSSSEHDRESRSHGRLSVDGASELSDWLLRARRSASALSGPSDNHRIRIMPGEKNDQYHRKRARAAASVDTTRVSVLNRDSSEPTGSARSVQAIEELLFRKRQPHSGWSTPRESRPDARSAREGVRRLGP